LHHRRQPVRDREAGREGTGQPVGATEAGDEQDDAKRRDRDREPRDQRRQAETPCTGVLEHGAVAGEHAARSVGHDGDMPPPASIDTTPYDALLLVSFGGPEKAEDVVPFLENVTRGRGIPRERLAEVGEHYFRLGGRSPINDINRTLLDA